MTGPRVSLSHAGFHVNDMDKMIDFYTSVFGLTLSGPWASQCQGPGPRKRAATIDHN